MGKPSLSTSGAEISMDAKSNWRSCPEEVMARLAGSAFPEQLMNPNLDPTFPQKGPENAFE